MIKSITKNGNSTMIEVEFPTMPAWLAKMIAEKKVQDIKQQKEWELRHTTIAPTK